MTHETYSAPELTILEIAVENGFATSTGGGKNPSMTGGYIEDADEYDYGQF